MKRKGLFLNAVQPINAMEPINREIFLKNIVPMKPGQSTSQTNIFLKSGIGANLPFIDPDNLRTIPILSRSAAMTGSADSAPSTILPTIGQPTKLINLPKRSKFLICPEQYNADAETDPPEPKTDLGPEFIHTWSHDQNDIGFDGIANPNPINGLPPLDPVEQINTIQPNAVLTNIKKRTLFTTRTRKKINNAHGTRINIPINMREIKIQNAVNDAIWGRR